MDRLSHPKRFAAAKASNFGEKRPKGIDQESQIPTTTIMSSFMLIREASDRTALYIDDQDDDEVIVNNKTKPSARMPTVMEESNLRDSVSSKGSVTLRAIRPRMGKTPSQLLGQLMGSAKTNDKVLSDSQDEEYCNPLYSSSENPLFGK